MRRVIAYAEIHTDKAAESDRMGSRLQFIKTPRPEKPVEPPEPEWAKRLEQDERFMAAWRKLCPNDRAKT
jgi:hypothetical protein